MRMPLNSFRSRCFPVPVFWSRCSSSLSAWMAFFDWSGCRFNDGNRSHVLFLGCHQVVRGFQRAGHGLLAMLGADLDAVGGNEFRIADADEGEYRAQIGLEVLERRHRRARSVIAAA